jgi:enoyl-CoA hydratase
MVAPEDPIKYIRFMYTHFRVEISQWIAHVVINRPQKANALHQEAWAELKAIFEALDVNMEVRAIVLSGEGKLFCAGIDLELLMSVVGFEKMPEPGRTEKLYEMVRQLQDCVTAIEVCSKPVIAAIHNGCIGGGVDIVAACDLRYCTEDAYFTIKEIDMGMVADLGTLQRLPKFVHPAIVAEMAFTGRPVGAAEAKQIGLVNDFMDSKETMLTGVARVAETIASKSPISIRGTKAILRQARDHAVPESLEFMAQWNARKLLSPDLKEAFQALREKRKPDFRS